MFITFIAMMTVLWVLILHRYLRPARDAMRGREEYNQSYWN